MDPVDLPADGNCDMQPRHAYLLALRGLADALVYRRMGLATDAEVGSARLCVDAFGSLLLDGAPSEGEEPGRIEGMLSEMAGQCFEDACFRCECCAHGLSVEQHAAYLGCGQGQASPQDAAIGICPRHEMYGTPDSWLCKEFEEAEGGEAIARQLHDEFCGAAAKEFEVLRLQHCL